MSHQCIETKLLKQSSSLINSALGNTDTSTVHSMSRPHLQSSRSCHCLVAFNQNSTQNTADSAQKSRPFYLYFLRIIIFTPRIAPNRRNEVCECSRLSVFSFRFFSHCLWHFNINDYDNLSANLFIEVASRESWVCYAHVHVIWTYFSGQRHYFSSFGWMLIIFAHEILIYQRI